LAVYPLIVAVVCGLFAAVVLGQYRRRRHTHQLVWTVALTLGLLAAVCYVVFLDSSDNDVAFKLYYVCGGLLMAAYLGLGSVYLLAPRPWAHLTAGLVILLSVVGVILLLPAGVDHGKLAVAASTVGPGTSALRPGAWKALVAILNSFGALAVVGGAVYSAWNTVRRGAAIRYLWANVLIATGTFLAALAGAAADQGGFAGSFWLVLTLGFVVLFAGFLVTMQPGRPARPLEVSSLATGPKSGP